jgi:cell division protein ZapA (FtsZ GTPase activity inhibitor)
MASIRITMSKEEVKSIQVNIAGRSYPLKIKSSDESKIRLVVDGVNEKINTFQLTYTGRDKQDLLSMALLTYAVELQSALDSFSDSGIESKLKAIDELLDQVIN